MRREKQIPDWVTNALRNVGAGEPVDAQAGTGRTVCVITTDTEEVWRLIIEPISAPSRQRSK